MIKLKLVPVILKLAGNIHEMKDKILFSQPVKVFLIWRILLVLISLATVFLTYRPDFAYTSPCYYKDNCTFAEKKYLYAWANFDGVHYLNIAAKGYIDQARFLPLYPLLIKLTNVATGQKINLWLLLGALLISNLSLVGALLVIKKIFKIKPQIFQWWLILFLTFPSSFFLVSVYAESLVIFLVSLMFWFLDNKRWRWAVLMAALLPIVKLQGLMIWPVLAWLLIKKRKQYQLNWLSWLWTITILVLPILAYVNFNQSKWQDPLYFIHAHGELANARATSNLVFPLQTVWRYLKILLTFNFNYEYGIAGLELASFGFLCWLFYLAWKQKLALKWWLYSLSIIFLPLFSGTFSGLPRYILLTFPLWLGLANLKSLALKRLLLFSFVVLQIVLMLFFFNGYFVA